MGQVRWSCNVCAMSGSGVNWSQLDRSAAKHNEETKHATATRTVGSLRTRDAAGVVRNALIGGSE